MMMMRNLPAFLLIGLAGCGLSDYQRQMDAQRARIKEFDDTNNLLDDPIEMPTIESADKQETPAWLLDFYLRLPRGCGAMPKDRTPYFAPLPFFRYAGPGPGYNYFVCAAVLLEPKAQAEYDKYPMKDFRSYVVQAINDFYFKTYKSRIELKPPDQTPPLRKFVKPFWALTGGAGADEQIGYDEFAYETTGKDASHFRVYFHEQRGKQIGIVAQRPRQLPADSTFEKGLEACLATLDMSAEAPSRRQQFKDRKR